MDPSAQANSTGLHAIPQCDHCGQTEHQIKRKLKRCGGCAVATYCSRECQKAGWHEHKKFCRESNKISRSSSQPDAGFAGYPAPITLANAIKSWVEVHDYGFTTIANGVALLNGNVEHTFLTPHAFLVELDVGTHSADNDNPATAFKLINCSILSKAGLGPLANCDARQWASREACCHQVTERMHQMLPDRAFSGVLPALFVTMNTGITVWHHFTVSLLRHRRTSELDTPTSAVLKDVIGMCKRAMNTGLIYRVPESFNKFEPNVGILVRRRKQDGKSASEATKFKRWGYEAQDETAHWEDLACKMKDRRICESGLHPREIWYRLQTIL
ncbi:hypothetical protein C8Q79DRAFT_905099 [Trametes meyenii]|nr:hypothetical protein C8Q79DRAFT_905099 [Trametes meyenii]